MMKSIVMIVLALAMSAANAAAGDTRELVTDAIELGLKARDSWRPWLRGDRQQWIDFINDTAYFCVYSKNLTREAIRQANQNKSCNPETHPFDDRLQDLRCTVFFEKTTYDKEFPGVCARINERNVFGADLNQQQCAEVLAKKSVCDRKQQAAAISQERTAGDLDTYGRCGIVDCDSLAAFQAALAPIVTAINEKTSWTFFNAKGFSQCALVVNTLRGMTQPLMPQLNSAHKYFENEVLAVNSLDEVALATRISKQFIPLITMTARGVFETGGLIAKKGNLNHLVVKNMDNVDWSGFQAPVAEAIEAGTYLQNHFLKDVNHSFIGDMAKCSGYMKTLIDSK